MKYISFCLYGDDLKYYKGAEKNLILIKELLPDWIPVIYYSPSNFRIEFLDILKELGGRLVDVSTIEISKYLTYPMFWRYLIFFETGYSIVRDLDSRISEREVKYINNWVNSELDYFIIRDHPWHSLVPGGLVGLKLNDDKIKDFFIEFVKNNGLGWGTDQEMLSKYFENIDKKNVYYCGFDDETNYIKRDNLDFFIGIQLDEDDKPLIPSATLALDFLKSINL